MTYRKRRRTGIMVINQIMAIAIGVMVGVLLMAAADVIDYKNKKH